MKYASYRNFFFIVLIVPMIWLADVQAVTHQTQPTNITQSTNQQELLSQAELAQILAPIALYPDTLLTHILIASTYPLEVIDAQRWLSKNNINEQLTNDELYSQTAYFDWDASIKALLPFAQVLQKMSEELSWTRKLGDAFLESESQVLASIQQLRQQAEQAGSLAKMDNVSVNKEQDKIIIQPVQKEVVYVPYYDTRIVYGDWYWAHYPPIYWHYPNYYTSVHYPFYWHHSVHIGVNFFLRGFHWSNHQVIINHHNRYRISLSQGAKRWQHNSQHRRGVAYRSAHSQQKFHSNRVNRSHVKMTRHAENRSAQPTQNISHNKSIHSKQFTKLNKRIKHSNNVRYRNNDHVKTKQHVTANPTSSKWHKKVKVIDSTYLTKNSSKQAKYQPPYDYAKNQSTASQQKVQSKQYKSNNHRSNGPSHKVDKHLPTVQSSTKYNSTRHNAKAHNSRKHHLSKASKGNHH